MSNTRRAEPDDETRQERWASSAQFQRGLMGNLVARRLSLIDNPQERELHWFLQLLSHRQGGLTEISEDLARFSRYHRNTPSEIAENLKRACLDPECVLNNCCFLIDDIMEHLSQFKSDWIAARQKGVVVTEIGRRVSDTLDYALEGRCMTIIDGVARSGKTYAAKSWCEQHPGRARYVQVPSSGDDIGFFRAIAKSLGVSINLNSKAQQLRDRVEDTLQTGNLLICFDEAHHLWPCSNYRDALPNRISWIMTALVNYEVPVCLVTTPQFMRTQKRIEDRTRWTSEQFMGRIGHYEKLPDSLSKSDLSAVSKSLLPDGDEKTIGVLVNYALASCKYLAGIEIAVRRARYLAARDGRIKVTLKHVKTAIGQNVIASDRALAQALAETEKGRRQHPRSAFESPLQPVGNGAARFLNGHEDLAAKEGFEGRGIEARIKPAVPA